MIIIAYHYAVQHIIWGRKNNKTEQGALERALVQYKRELFQEEIYDGTVHSLKSATL